MRSLLTAVFLLILLITSIEAHGQVRPDLIEAPIEVRLPGSYRYISAYYASDSDRFFVDAVEVLRTTGLRIDTLETGIVARDAYHYIAISRRGATLVLARGPKADGIPIDSTLFFVSDGRLFLDLETLTSVYEGWMTFDRENLVVHISSSANFFELDRLIKRGAFQPEDVPVLYPRRRLLLGPPSVAFYATQPLNSKLSPFSTIDATMPLAWGNASLSLIASENGIRPIRGEWTLDIRPPVVGYTRLLAGYNRPVFSPPLPETFFFIDRFSTTHRYVGLSNWPLTPDQVQRRESIVESAEPGSVVETSSGGFSVETIKVTEEGVFRTVVPVTYGLSTTTLVVHRLGGLPPITRWIHVYTPPFFIPAGKFRYMTTIDVDDPSLSRYLFGFSTGRTNLLFGGIGTRTVAVDLGILPLRSVHIGGAIGVNDLLKSTRSYFAGVTGGYFTPSFSVDGAIYQQPSVLSSQRISRLQVSMRGGPVTLSVGTYTIETELTGKMPSRYVVGSLFFGRTSLTASYTGYSIGSSSYSNFYAAMRQYLSIGSTTVYTEIGGRKSQRGQLFSPEVEYWMGLTIRPRLNTEKGWRNLELSLDLIRKEGKIIPSVSLQIQSPFLSGGIVDRRAGATRIREAYVYGTVRGGWPPMISSNGVLQAGVLRVIVFEDVDGDGRLTDEDVLHPEVDVFVPGAMRRRTSWGTVIEGLDPYRIYPLRIDPASLVDPLLEPLTGWTFGVVADPTGIRTIYVPLVRKTMLHGRVSMRMPVRYEVHLIRDGQIVVKTEVFSDGSYSLLVPQGDYEVRLYDTVEKRYVLFDMQVSIRGEDQKKFDIAPTYGQTNE